MEPCCVVVPVHDAAAVVQRCLVSLGDTLDGSFRLVIVDDASEDVAFRNWLEAFCADNKATLHRLDSNQGFVRAANVGFALAEAADVVLLNSDTVVPAGWLPRLRQAADADERIATITPLSNNGDVCSYPLMPAGALPSGCSAASLDRLCSELNGGACVDIPTGVGFCLYIKRACLDDVGGFDEEAFGRGYGEENDFCMRAAKKGWRHVCHTGVYVEHTGGVSFGEERKQRMQEADRTLARLHPEYEQTVRDFLRADPLAAYRERLDARRLQDPAQQPVVLAEWRRQRAAEAEKAGRTEQSLRDEIDAYVSRCDHYEALLREHRDTFAQQQQQLAGFTERCAEYERLLSESRAATAQVTAQLGELQQGYENLADQFQRVNAALTDSTAQLETVTSELVATRHLRDDLRFELDRLNALWFMRAGRRLKRLLGR